MGEPKLLPELLDRINQNQLAIAAAVEEMSSWIEQRGSTAVATHVREALSTLDANAEFITDAIKRLQIDSV